MFQGLFECFCNKIVMLNRFLQLSVTKFKVINPHKIKFYTVQLNNALHSKWEPKLLLSSSYLDLHSNWFSGIYNEKSEVNNITSICEWKKEKRQNWSDILFHKVGGLNRKQQSWSAWNSRFGKFLLLRLVIILQNSLFPLSFPTKALELICHSSHCYWKSKWRCGTFAWLCVCVCVHLCTYIHFV